MGELPYLNVRQCFSRACGVVVAPLGLVVLYMAVVDHRQLCTRTGLAVRPVGV